MTAPNEASNSLTCIEDLADLSPEVMRHLCTAFDNDILMVALKSAPDEVRDAVFAGFPPRQAAVMGDTVPAVGIVTMEEIENAQRQVVEAANILIGFNESLGE